MALPAHVSTPDIDLVATINKLADDLGDASLAATNMAQSLIPQKDAQYWKLVFLADSLDRGAELLSILSGCLCHRCQREVTSALMHMQERNGGAPDKP